MLKFYLHRLGFEPGSIACQATILPRVTSDIFTNLASSGIRTRVYRVAGDNSTTEPPMLAYNQKCQKLESMVLSHRN